MCGLELKSFICVASHIKFVSTCATKIDIIIIHLDFVLGGCRKSLLLGIRVWDVGIFLSVV